MSSLKTNEKQILEKLFQMSTGYVLNFSDRTMEEFFRDNLGINVYSDIYNYASGSKANRMRGFWMRASDELVSKSVADICDYIETQLLIGNLRKEDFPSELLSKGRDIVLQLRGLRTNSQTANKTNQTTEEEFINKEFKNISLDVFGLDGVITEVLKQRLEEIRKCLHAKSPLAVVFLCGSTLEGFFLGLASKYPKEFNQSNSAPSKDDKILEFQEWSLSNFIDVGRELGIVGEDVKKYSHALRDFRNYIHPYQQMISGFNPQEHTAKISWQVLQAAIYEMSDFNKNYEK